MIKSINLDYDYSIFLTADYSQNEGSCIKHQIHELKDIHDVWGGFPTSYCYENTKINQLWWNENQIDFANIGKQLGIAVVTVSSIKQPPGCVIPLHRDTFFQINKKYPNNNQIKVRANIFLEDWRLGHFLQYDDKISTHWLAGSGFLWDSSVLHLSANAGMQDKFTLQISGFLL